MKPWIIVLIVLAVIAVILGLLYYFGKKAQTKQAAQQEQMEAMKQTVSMLIIDKKKLRMKDSGLPPVSYTHLDVYKRQSSIRGKNRWFSFPVSSERLPPYGCTTTSAAGSTF